MTSTPKIGSSVAFIFNAAWVVPATVERVWPGSRINLRIQEIQLDRVVSVKGEGLSVQVEEVEKFIIKPNTRLRVAECNPCSIIERQEKALSRPMSGNGMHQSVTDQWVAVDEYPLPRLNGIEPTLIGKWFDPSPWHYQVYAHMVGFENKILKRSWQSMEHVFLGLDGKPFQTFNEAFEVWFAEQFSATWLHEQGIPSSWERVEIQAVEKQPVAGAHDWNRSGEGVFPLPSGQIKDGVPTYEELLARYHGEQNGHTPNPQRNQPKPQRNRAAASTSKSRSARNRGSLPKSGKRK